MRLRNKTETTLLLVLAAVLLLSGTALGDFEYDFASQSLDEIIPLYMAGHGLDENNFAMGWYDLTSGEEWFFGSDNFMVAGSMYKLPLNMAYTDKLASGDLRADDFAGVYTVERAMEMSIVYSDNDAADALHSALNLSHRDYRLLLAQYSGLDESELPEEYFSDNCISPRFMINTLVFLYDNSVLYSGLIEQMKSAHPGRFFKKDEGEYAIAHKYGYFEGGLNDCGIVYSPRPFALVVFTRKVRDGEDILSQLCRLMTEYSLYLDSLPEPEPGAPGTEAGEAYASAPPREPSPPPSGVPAAALEPEPELPDRPAVAGPEPAPDFEGHITTARPLFGPYAAICAALLILACIRRLALEKRRAGKGGHKH